MIIHVFSWDIVGIIVGEYPVVNPLKVGYISDNWYEFVRTSIPESRIIYPGPGIILSPDLGYFWDILGYICG